MELDNRNTIIIIVAIICVTFILGAALYLNSNGATDGGISPGINPFEEKEPIHIINTTFSTAHSLDAKTVCTINVGANHSKETVDVEVLYSRGGTNLNDGDRTTKTVGSDGSIICESKDSYDKYPDHASVRLYDADGNLLDSADVTLATDDSTQLAVGNGTVKAKSITKAEHSASGSKSSSSKSKGVTEWVEDLDLSDKAGYECHVYIHHRSDGTKYYIDEDGKKYSSPESEEWVF